MKKLLVLVLSLSFATSAFAAGPRDGRGNFKDRKPVVIHRSVRPIVRRPVVIRERGPSWVGPALVLGAITGAVIVANQDRPERTVIIHEPTPVNIIQEKTIFEKITGGEAGSLTLAQNKWQVACSDWQNELDHRFISDYNTTCGSMTCVTGSNNYCYSTGNATVSYR